MKKSKKEPEWIKPLRNHLRNTFRSEHLVVYDKVVTKRAIEEIIRGVKFCAKRKLDISVTLENSFDIGDNCRCLLAKNSPPGYTFEGARGRLGICHKYASSMGFSASYTSRCLLGKLSTSSTMAHWRLIYNTLWRAVGQFFKGRQYEVA